MDHGSRGGKEGGKRESRERKGERVQEANDNAKETKARETGKEKQKGDLGAGLSGGTQPPGTFRPAEVEPATGSTGLSFPSVPIARPGLCLPEPPPQDANMSTPRPAGSSRLAPGDPGPAPHTRRKAGLTNFQHSLQYRPGLNPIICWMSLLNLSTPANTRAGLSPRPPRSPRLSPAAPPREPRQRAGQRGRTVTPGTWTTWDGPLAGPEQGR